MTDRTQNFIDAWNNRISKVGKAEIDMAQIDIYPIPRDYYMMDGDRKVYIKGHTLASNFFTAWISTEPTEPSYLELGEMEQDIKLFKVMEDWLVNILIQHKHESSACPNAAELLNQKPLKV